MMVQWEGPPQVLLHSAAPWIYPAKQYVGDKELSLSAAVWPGQPGNWNVVEYFLIEIIWQNCHAWATFLVQA